MEKVLVHNCRTLESGDTPDNWVIFSDRVLKTGNGPSWEQEVFDVSVDAAGGCLTPAMVDTHTHGGNGHSPSSDIDSLRAIRDFQKSQGVYFGVISLVTSDMVTPHYSHFGEDDGIVAAVGTGTLFFAVSGENQARIDGLGAMLGYNGSAYWIGREALRRSSRQYELGNPSWLIDQLQQIFGKYSQWPKKFASGELKTFEIAQLSKLVAKGAELEDSLSLEIIDQAAELIAESIIALSKKLAVDDVALTGGVLKSKLILERVTKLLEQHSLHSTLMSGSAVIGSFQLAKHFESPRIRFLESQQQLFRWEG